MKRLKTTHLFPLPAILMVTMGSAIGGTSGMVIAFIMALSMDFFSCWIAAKIVFKMFGTQEFWEDNHPAFYGMFRRLAIQAGLPMPKVCIVSSENPMRAPPPVATPSMPLLQKMRESVLYLHGRADRTTGIACSLIRGFSEGSKCSPPA